MARTNAQQWLEKWSRRLNAAGPDIQTGIDRVKEAPGMAAARAQALFAQRLMESINNGTWAKNVSAVSLQSWQDSMKNKGIPRLATGVSQAVKSKAQVIGDLLSAVDTASAAAKEIPKGGIDASIARASAYMRKMQELAPKRKKA
jgi:hypothetical protein